MVDQCVLIGVKANMFKPEQVGKRTRYTYAKINEVIKMPHLLDIQRKSYEWFLESGLQNIFNDISPIKDNSGNLVLSFEGFSLGEPKYDINECKNRDATYAAPLRVNIASGSSGCPHEFTACVALQPACFLQRVLIR